jgi:predicted ribosomally synthesized peptide with SipW-like signal peptide
MGKIWKSSLVVLAVAVAVGGATYSFFSDSETSTSNTFTAGAIDLSIGSQFSSNGNANGGPVAFGLDSTNDGRTLYTFTDLKPGDFGSGSFQLSVTSNESYACAMTTIDAVPDNGIVDPESDAGDVTNGPQAGELQNFLQFATFADLNGNGVRDPAEPLNVNQYNGGDGNGFTTAQMAAAGWIPVADPSSPNTWLTIGSLLPNTTYNAGFMYCFGDFDSNGVCSINMSSNDNLAQTDGISGSLVFQAVQTRNNASFLCSQQPVTKTVRANDLAETLGEVVSAPYSWFFWNDTNDTVMPINQFAGTGGVNDIVAGPSAEGAAQMTLDTGVNPRYNIATTKYGNVKLSDIGSLKYRIYDASASSETPFLNFNVDFNNSNVWQRRLVQVPTGVVANTWTTVDALAGSWTYSGAFWPIGGSELGTTPGTTPKTWASILADYPLIETLSTGSWLGVRVGHPGPVGEESYVDWVEFDGETTDFEN